MLARRVHQGGLRTTQPVVQLLPAFECSFYHSVAYTLFPTHIIMDLPAVQQQVVSNWAFSGMLYCSGILCGVSRIS